MNKLDEIYILVERVAWEGDTILGVYADAAAANDEREACTIGTTDPDNQGSEVYSYHVLKYPVVYS